jgi:hypothetical protein
MYNIWGEEGVNISSGTSSVRKLQAVSYTKHNVCYSQFSTTAVFFLGSRAFHAYLIYHCENVSHLHEELLSSVQGSVHTPRKCCDGFYHEVTFL